MRCSKIALQTELDNYRWLNHVIRCSDAGDLNVSK